MNKYKNWLVFTALLFFNIHLSALDSPVLQSKLPADHAGNAAELPLDLQRRAVNTLEQQRFVGEGEWSEAKLTGQAVPLFRPDLEEPAFYELKVSPAGFMILSTGFHDNPVVHLSKNAQQTITERLVEKAEGRPIAKFYRIDALSFLAEDENGEKVAVLGDLPYKLRPLSPGEQMVELGVEVSFPDSDAAEEVQQEPLVESLGMVDAPFEFEDWGSWNEMKAEYAEIYGSLIDQLAQAATEDWETEALVRDYGEGLRLGETFLTPLLYEDVDIVISGEGAQYAEVQRIHRDDMPDVVQIQPYESVEGADLTLEFNYANGQSEQLLFFFVDQLHGKHWSRVFQIVVGSNQDQRRYNQFQVNGCASGCGPTAWAMLFGWADHQAWLNSSRWSHRWGLYRVNGGYGADADAPRHMDQGVRNMVNELRFYLGTYCSGASGATPVWNMHNGYKYLRNRTGTKLKSRWDIFFGLDRDARNHLMAFRTPVIIGTGYWSHLPLAWGYQLNDRIVRTCFGNCWMQREFQRRLLVNQGWGGESNDWIVTGSFFLGEIFPN